MSPHPLLILPLVWTIGAVTLLAFDLLCRGILALITMAHKKGRTP